MEIERTSLYREIEQITKSGAKSVHFTYSALVHPIEEGGNYEVMKVITKDTVRDYEQNYADLIVLKVLIPNGTYATRIYPYQSNLEITIVKTPINEVGDVVNAESSKQHERYMAVLVDKGSPTLQQAGMHNLDEETMNLTGFTEVEFQLFEKPFEQLRLISVGGIFRKSKVEDVIKAILTNESRNVKVDNQQAIKGVDMVPSSNQQTREHIVIPHGTRLMELPAYIHKFCGGVYSAGLGYYFQKDYWYLYPCFDTKRLNTSKRTMTFILIPPRLMPGVERTFRQDGSHTVVLATGEVRFKDNSEVQQLNAGNGIRFTNASDVMEGFNKTTNNKTETARGDINSEFVASNRKNGNNIAPMSNSRITANPFYEYSKIAPRLGGLLTMVWENSDPSLITPGLMTKVLYLKNGEIKELEGVVLKVHHYADMIGEGITSMRYGSRSVVSIFVKNDE